MLLVTLEKIGTRPIGSTMMNRATVARTRSTVGSGVNYLPCCVVGREGFEPTTFAV